MLPSFSAALLFVPHTIVMDEDVILADGKTNEILAGTKLLEAHELEKPYVEVKK